MDNWTIRGSSDTIQIEKWSSYLAIEKLTFEKMGRTACHRQFGWLNFHRLAPTCLSIDLSSENLREANGMQIIVFKSVHWLSFIYCAVKRLRQLQIIINDMEMAFDEPQSTLPLSCQSLYYAKKEMLLVIMPFFAYIN